MKGLQLQLKSAEGSDVHAEMFFDVIDKMVEFTVITDSNQQFDFAIDERDWLWMRLFVDSKLGVNNDTVYELRTS